MFNLVTGVEKDDAWSRGHEREDIERSPRLATTSGVVDRMSVYGALCSMNRLQEGHRASQNGPKGCQMRAP